MSLKDNVDFSTFSDPKAATELFSNSIRKGFEYDSYGGKTNFKAVVLTTPIPVSPKDIKYFLGDIKFKSRGRPDKVSKFTYRARIVGENSPHSFLPDPCSTEFADNPTAALEVVSMHTLFVCNSDGDALDVYPRIGSTVEVELTKNAYSYNIQFGKHVKVVTNPDTPNKPSAECDSIRSAFESASGGATSLGGGVGTVIIELANSLPKLQKEDGTIVGTPLPALTPIVEKELSRWSGKKESDPTMNDTLKKYWDLLVVPSWTPSLAWSAAFISWVVCQVDPAFPKKTFHTLYAKSASKGQGGWSAWATGGAKIKAQVGDILVRTRTGEKVTELSSHGDVVYKIESGKALLAGGNLGNTAKTVQLPIDSDGNYISYTVPKELPYIVILKKKGTLKKAPVS